jgi:hypothetical protein
MEGGLAPGKVLHDAIDISQLYDLSQPGEYTIRFQRADPTTKLTVTSNSLALVIAN